MYALIFADTMLFLSTLSLRRATAEKSQVDTTRTISIHALLAESDAGSLAEVAKYATFLSTLSLRRATGWTLQNHQDTSPISIHALLAESDETIPGRTRNAKKFLSTLSLRRATDSSLHSSASCSNFYPRSPCGERRCDALGVPYWAQFLSTLSLRRATARRASRQQPAGISIHALLAESDL